MNWSFAFFLHFNHFRSSPVVSILVLLCKIRPMKYICVDHFLKSDLYWPPSAEVFYFLKGKKGEL